MNTTCKRLPILIFWLFALQGECGELLGKINDETAHPANQEQTAADKKNKIIYRVICPTDGEILPDCEQAPVDDFFEDIQSPSAEPENPKTAEISVTREQAPKPKAQDIQNSKAVKQITLKKSVAHKKHARKSEKRARLRVKRRLR